MEKPEAALAKLSRVSCRYVLVSVPREPIWRAMNVARSAYVSALGNTPGHVNHWTSGSFESFVQRHLEILERRRPLPWTVLLGRVRGSS